MNRNFIATILILFCTSCQKDDSGVQLVYRDYILAGESSTQGINHNDRIPNDTIEHNENTIRELEHYRTTMNLDINSDKIEDFQIGIFTTIGFDVRYIGRIIPLGNNSIAMDSTNLLIDTLGFNDRIDSTLNWQSREDYRLKWGILYSYDGIEYQEPEKKGLWNGQKNKYVGIRIENEDKIIYGWIGLEIEIFPEHVRVIIKEFAYTNGDRK